jgi:hypothetical protein
LATAAVAETHSIGTQGATIPGDTWERHTFSNQLGPDQFARPDRNFALVFVETFGLFEERTDFLETLNHFFNWLKTRSECELVGEDSYVRAPAFSRGTLRLSCTLGGLELGYELDLISAGDGLGYLAMSWSPWSDFEGLQEEVERTLNELKLPGPDSEWGRSATPTTHELAFGDWKLELQFRDSVFNQGDSQPGQRYSFVTRDGNVTFHVFLDELEGDADDVLDSIKEVATERGEYEELARTDLELDLGPGRQLLSRSTQESPPHDLAIAAIGLGDDRWVDLRMVSADRTGHRQSLWDGLLRSLRVTRPPQVDAFPVVESSTTGEPPYVAPWARRLLEASHAFGAHGSDVLALRGDKLLVRDDNQLELHALSRPEDASTTVLYASDSYVAGKLVPWGDRIFLLKPDGQVSEIAEGELQPAGFEADAAVAAGDELLVARNGREEPLLVFAGLPAVGPAEILARDADGGERRVAELPGDDVVALARRPAGDVLAAVTSRTAPALATGGVPNRLLLLRDGRDGAVEIGLWDRIDRLEPAPGGWLVTGTPDSGRHGVFRVDDAGRAELLLSGDPVGLSLTDEALTFVTGSCLEPSDGFYPKCVYRADLERVRELGPTFQPFSSQLLNDIGARVQAERGGSQGGGFPPTRQAISELAATASALARELTGSDLPHSPDGVDALLSQFSWDRDLSEPAVVLLSVLLTESLLAEGAVWEEAAALGPPARADLGWELENSFAVGLHPVAAVLSTLYEEDGWYRPAHGIVEAARGRTLVLGIDPERVRARVRAAATAGLDDLLAEGRTSQLLALLENQPDNVYLREAVYRRLTALGRFDELATLAETFADREETPGIDRLAWTAARLRGELTPSQLDEVIAGLRDAIENEPDDANWYLLLGAAYERTSGPERLALARASYQKAGQTVRWGSLHRAAEQALNRLADEE